MSKACKNFETCSAPLCPMDTNPAHIWFPDEEICILKGFASLGWVRKQKLVAKKHGTADGFFTIKMLQALRRVVKGVVGANSDTGMGAEEQWLKDRGLEKLGGITALR